MPRTADTFHMRRMRRPLNVTVTGDLGLETGKVVWMDEEVILVLLRTRLAPGVVRRVRLDLGHVSRTVDLEIDVQQHRPGQGTIFKGGHVHRCGFRLVDPADAAAVDQCLATLNPQAQSVPPSTWSTYSTRSGLGKEARSRSTGGTDPNRSGRARIVKAIQRSTQKRREPPPQPSPAPPVPPKLPERRSRVPAARVPAAAGAPVRQSVTEDLLVTPQWSPGPPPSLYAVYSSRPALRRGIEFHDTGARAVLAAGCPVEVGDVVELVLQLPDGSMLQLIAMVQRRGEHRLWVDVQFMPPEALALLHSLAD